MNERQAVAVLSPYLEHLLKRHGLLDERGEVKVDDSGGLPAELQCRLDGLIETAAELRGLVKIARDAHQGEPISPAVANAARLMAEGICRTLAENDHPLPETKLH